MGKKKIWFFGTCTVAVLLFITLSFYEFYHSLQRNETFLQQDALQEVATRETAIVNLKLNDYINSLYSLEEFMEDDPLYTEENMQHLKNVEETLGFERMGIVSPSGKVYLTDGTTDTMQHSAYFKNLMLNQSSIFDAKTADESDTKQFAITIPAKNKAGVIHGALLGFVDSEDFQTCKDHMDSDIHSWDTYVIDRSGNYILSYQHAASDPQNLVESIQSKRNHISQKALGDHLLAGESFSALLTMHQSDYLAIFSPLDFNGWYSVVTMPIDEINNHSTELLENSIYPLTLKLFFSIGLLSLVIIYSLIHSAKQEQKKEKALIEGLTSSIIRYMEVDLETNQIFHSAEDGKMKKSMDIPFSQYLETLIEKTVHPDYKELVYHNASPQHIIDLFQKGVYNNVFNFLSYNNSNSIIWIECETHVTLDEETGHLMCYYMLRNITDKKREERNLKEKAEHDALTGLYNRGTAADLINQFLSFNTDRNLQHAFIIIDLDNFKNVNDKLGHKTGDIALQEVSKILSDFFRKEDIVCRLGGDEFVIFLKFISVTTTEEKLKQLLPCLRLTYKNDEHEVQISGSIGVAFAYNDGNHFKDL